MANSNLPYIAQPSVITKILNKIKEARTPDRFTHDLLRTNFAFKSGNDRQFIPFAKKIGLLKSDGTPTNLYKKFRNSTTSGAAIAEATRIGYREIFDRNEYAHNLNSEDFQGLIIEITGFKPSDNKVNLIYSTYKNLASHANFNDKLDEVDNSESTSPDIHDLGTDTNEFDLNLSYSINLVLPKSNDQAVFNAIFKALRDNLLRK